MREQGALDDDDAEASLRNRERGGQSDDARTNYDDVRAGCLLTRTSH
jgi:hypothetical protein